MDWKTCGFHPIWENATTGETHYQEEWCGIMERNCFKDECELITLSKSIEAARKELQDHIKYQGRLRNQVDDLSTNFQHDRNLIMQRLKKLEDQMKDLNHLKEVLERANVRRFLMLDKED